LCGGEGLGQALNPGERPGVRLFLSRREMEGPRRYVTDHTHELCKNPHTCRSRKPVRIGGLCHAAAAAAATTTAGGHASAARASKRRFADHVHSATRTRWVKADGKCQYQLGPA